MAKVWRIATAIALIAAPALAQPPASLAYYPPAARAAGVEGSATIHCARTPQLALTGCTLVSETPAGQGFGPAALDLAAHSNPDLQLNVMDDVFRAPFDQVVTFRLKPPTVAPDLTAAPHTVTPPAILAKPDARDVERAYPKAAARAELKGHVLLDCAVTSAGALADCTADDETPAGHGFADAALSLTGKYKMKPRALDGAPLAGGRVRLPFDFAPPQPLTF